jgi:hypothetical protein
MRSKHACINVCISNNSKSILTIAIISLKMHEMIRYPENTRRQIRRIEIPVEQISSTRSNFLLYNKQE